LAILVGFAPTIIVKTGVWKSLLSMAAPEIAPHVQIGALRLSWFAPMELDKVALSDAAGQPLAEVAVVRSRKTLLGIALNPRDVGVFEVEEPRAVVQLRADGSNVEDLLAKLPKSQSKSSGGGFGLALVKGVVQLDDQVAGRQWLIDGLQVDLAWPVRRLTEVEQAAKFPRPFRGNRARKIRLRRAPARQRYR
jgi:hypothetical protein